MHFELNVNFSRIAKQALSIVKAYTPDNLDELYDRLPEEERVIAMILRDLILETLPGIREKKSYGAPFYFGRKAVCYVWPASITWGGKRQGQGVTLGFNQARLLSFNDGLTFNGRKMIGSVGYLSPEEIDQEWLARLLREAWRIDQE